VCGLAQSRWEIARQVYGDGRLWPVLLRDNHGAMANPNLIFVGQSFQVPALPTEELRRLLIRVRHVVD
jgi:nucleoid-associated protein YgaU